MNADDLSRAQVERVRDVVARQLNYLTRLTQRMDRIGWSPTDRLYQAAHEAQRAVHALHIRLHYASCLPGTVWQEMKPPPVVSGGGDRS